MSKENVFLKSTVRQPIFTSFLIILLGLISFAFIGKAVEYLVVKRETNRLGGYYRSIGELVSLSGDERADLSTGATLVQNSRYLAYEDRRKSTSGVMRGIWNSDISSSSSIFEEISGVHLGDMWFYGKLTTKRETLKKGEQETVETIGYTLNFQADTVLASYPENIIDGRVVGFLFLFEGNEASIPAIERMEVGEHYLIRGRMDTSFRVDPSWQNASSTLQIRALDGESIWYLPVAQGAELDFNDPALAWIKNEIDVLNENQHALLIYGTSDMSAMPQMQESARLFFLVEGRWLNHQDDLDGRRAIVIQRDFADLRKLKIGDTISVTLRGLQNPYAGYITREDWQNWHSFPTYEETLEIVGIYDDLPGISSATYTTWAYVPNSIIPMETAYMQDRLYEDNYSFVLDSSRNQDAFLNEMKEPLAKLGIGINFVENNGTVFWLAVDPLRRSAFSGLLVFTMVLVIALALVTFLYLSQRRKDYAILRALGVAKNAANRQLLMPIMLTSASGILTGSALAWNFALEKTAASFSGLPTPAGLLPVITLNLAYLGVICVGILLLLLLFTWLGIVILAGKPVLELLGRSAPAGAKKPAQPIAQAPTSLPPIRLTPEPDPSQRRLVDDSNAAAETIRNRIQPVAGSNPAEAVTMTGNLLLFGLRHISRSALKSILTILVAFGFMLALGWMQWSIDHNQAEVDRLYYTVVVEAEIIPANSLLTISEGPGVIAERTVQRMLESGFVQSVYTEAAAEINSIYIYATRNKPAGNYQMDGTLLAFDQPEEFFATLSTRDTLQYSKLWDESLFSKVWTKEEMFSQGVPAIFSESILNKYDLKMGNVLNLGVKTGGKNVMVYPYKVVGSYLENERQLSKNVIKSGQEAVWIPLSALRVILDNNLYYTTVKFILDPAKNRELPAFREEMIKMVAEPSAGRLPLQIVFWDEELRAVVEPLEKNLSLLEVLYPVTVAVSVLIGIGLSLLLVLQQARETALLRMLGVSRIRVRAMLSSEQLLLSFLGILLGLGLLVVLSHNPEAVLTPPILIAGGLYILGALIGSLIGAVIVTNKQPIDLLQVKE